MNPLSINVALLKQVLYIGKRITTGIFNEPVDGRVMVAHSTFKAMVRSIAGSIVAATWQCTPIPSDKGGANVAVVRPCRAPPWAHFRPRYRSTARC